MMRRGLSSALVEGEGTDERGEEEEEEEEACNQNVLHAPVFLTYLFVSRVS